MQIDICGQLVGGAWFGGSGRVKNFEVWIWFEGKFPSQITNLNFIFFLIIMETYWLLLFLILVNDNVYSINFFVEKLFLFPLEEIGIIWDKLFYPDLLSN